MAEMINVKVDVSKLDKDRFFKGKKGTYCDLVLIPTPSSDFGTSGISVTTTNGKELIFALARNGCRWR